jgi:apolipoprotein N-acyltransferase
MLKLTLQGAIALGLAGLFLCGCKRAETPSPKAQENEQAQSAKTQPQGQDLLKTQREALDRAKALGGQMQQQAKDQEKEIEAAQK